MEKNTDFVEKLVHINRITKVVKGGRRFGFSALVVVGNQAGKIGIAHAKAKQVPDAIKKANEMARRKLTHIPLREGRTIHHDVKAKDGSGKIVLRAASKGTGIIAGGPVRADDLKYRQSIDYSIWPFTHFGLKIVHHSLLDWFFPLVLQFDGGFSACHLFNILEIPFLKNIIVSHKFIYHNTVSGPSESSAPHHFGRVKNIGRKNMDKMWSWIQPASDIHDFSKFKKAEDIKKYFIKICQNKLFTPEANGSENIDYYNKQLLRLFFDPNHEYFKDRLK